MKDDIGRKGRIMGAELDIKAPVWTGKPSPASGSDWRGAASTLDVSVAHLRAIARVESGLRSVDPRGGVIRRFEPHIFKGDRSRWREWISISGDRRAALFAEAWATDPERAARATSWGLFQIMGFHATSLGYPSAVVMAQRMARDEAEHLRAMVTFLQAHDLDAPLRAGDIEAFSVGYNGSGQPDVYAAKLRQAISEEGGGDVPPVLSLGSRGSAVRRVQEVLGVTVDGVFGPETDGAVKALQDRQGLKVDGIVGRDTWRRLHESEGVEPPRSSSQQEGRKAQIAEGVGTISAGGAMLQHLTTVAPGWAVHVLWVVAFGAGGVWLWYQWKEGGGE